MADDGNSAFKRDFIDRVRSARATYYEIQQDLCDVLEIAQGTYKTYETDTFLPHWLIPRFCKACHVSLEWLFTGQGKGVRLIPPTEPAKRKRGRPRKRPTAAA